MVQQDLDKSGRIPQIIKTNLGPTVGWKYTDAPTDIEYVIGGGGDAIRLGYWNGLTIPDWLVVNNWLIYSPDIGSCVIDVYKITRDQTVAGVLPSAADSICGTDKPRLVGQRAAIGFALTGWTTRIDQNDTLGFNVDSVSGITLVTLVLQCVRIIGPS